MREVKVYQYCVKDPITGRRYLTRYKLTEEEVAERYPERERITVTEETRTIYDEGEIHSSHQLVFGSPMKHLACDDKPSFLPKSSNGDRLPQGSK